MLARLKVAAALAILRGSTAVEDDDWSLAAVVMEVSGRTRAHVQGHLAGQVDARATTKGKFNAKVRESEEREEDKRRRDKVKTVVGSVRNALSRLGEAGETDSDGWVASAVVRRRIKYALREWFEEAVESLENTGQVETKDAVDREGQIMRLKPRGAS